MHLLIAISCLLAAIGIGIAAQIIMRWTAASASRIHTQLSGYKAARLLLDGSNLKRVEIEQTPTLFSEHYDPRRKTLRLSRDTYHARTLTAVGFAAHETEQAISSEHKSLGRLIRALAIPAASFGSIAAIVLIVLGLMLQASQLSTVGIVIVCVVVALQLINLPFEHAVSRRAQARIVKLQVLDEKELPQLRRVLFAAALSNLAAAIHPIVAVYDLVISAVGRAA